MFQIRLALLLIGSGPNFPSADPADWMVRCSLRYWNRLRIGSSKPESRQLCVVAAVRGAAPYPPSVDNGRRQRRLRIRKAFLIGSYLVGACCATDMSDLLAAI